ncbi:hypothetical protein B9J78_05600 [bacterium Unc6]|nr:hypothetical protein [bacterium Unc6]
MKKFEIFTQRKTEFINITKQVQDIITSSDIDEGMCLIFIPHTTAALTVNEIVDPDVVSDIINHLERIVPEKCQYTHKEGNSDAHIKSSFIGCNVTIPVVKGKMALGTWQGVHFCEFDGPRTRLVYVKMIKDAVNI